MLNKNRPPHCSHIVYKEVTKEGGRMYLLRLPVMHKCFVAFYVILSASVICLAKVYERCELARELLFKHHAQKEQLSTWICIVEHESQYNTSAVGRLSGDSEDHGLFQISDKYWCSPPGYACAISCESLEDDDITDDWRCAKRIYRQHKVLAGDGFTAWAVYRQHCSGNTDKYLEGCLNESNLTEDGNNLSDRKDVNDVPTENVPLPNESTVLKVE